MKAEFRLDGKTHTCSIESGERKIDGMSVDDFLDTLTTTQILTFAKMGAFAVDKEIAGEQTRPGELQAIANGIHKSNNPEQK